MKKLIILFCVLIYSKTELYSQNKDSAISKINWAISLNTGFSSYGTGFSIHKNVSDNFNLEASYGIDLIIIPFLRFGPASNEHIVGLGCNYFVFDKSNIALNFSSFLHINPTYDESFTGDKQYLSISTYIAYIPSLNSDVPFFVKLGLNYYLKQAINDRKLEFNLAFGLVISL
jgi:hypothetical protein